MKFEIDCKNIGINKIASIKALRNMFGTEQLGLKHAKELVESSIHTPQVIDMIPVPNFDTHYGVLKTVGGLCVCLENHEEKELVEKIKTVTAYAIQIGNYNVATQLTGILENIDTNTKIEEKRNSGDDV